MPRDTDIDVDFEDTDTEEASEKLEETLEQTGQTVRRALDATSKFIERHPKSAFFLALFFGYMFGRGRSRD